MNEDWKSGGSVHVNPEIIFLRKKKKVIVTVIALGAVIGCCSRGSP